MKTVVITGTPGTGKTTISKKLAKKLDYYYLNVNRLISQYKLSEGYDRIRKTKIVDVQKLNKALIKAIKALKKNNLIFLKNKINGIASLSKAGRTKTLKRENITKNKNKIRKYNGIIIDSHLSHYLPRKYADFCIVTKCNIKELNKRLKNKKFHKNKIQENLQAEIFDVCYNEALERKHKILVINTTKSFNISSLVKQLGG